MLSHLLLPLLALSTSASFIGINLGNVLEAPTEGAWAPVAQEYYFDDYVAANFTRVRVPVRWDQHLGTSAPYTIDPVFLARVHEVVGWGLSRNLTVVINSHHDDWIDSAQNFSAQLPRFLALWAQVASSFAPTPQSQLLFEVLNEPVSLTLPQLNQLYSAVIPVMRVGNPVRPIYLGGLSWMSPFWIMQNPEAVVFPALPSGQADPNLRLEVHSYDPYGFCLQSPPTVSTWGSPADIAAVSSMYTGVAAWGRAHGRTAFMGEAGCQVQAPSRAGRLLWYRTVGSASAALEGITVWDDDGTWKLYNRAERTWDTEVLAALFSH